MYCRKCGKEINDRLTYCPNCGANQSKETTSFTTMLDIKEIKKNKVSKTKKNVMSTMAVFAFCFSLIGFFFTPFIFINLLTFGIFAGVFAFIGLILCFFGISQTKHNIRKGSSFAYTALSLSIISLIFLITIFVIEYAF